MVNHVNSVAELVDVDTSQLEIYTSTDSQEAKAILGMRGLGNGIWYQDVSVDEARVVEDLIATEREEWLDFSKSSGRGVSRITFMPSSKLVVNNRSGLVSSVNEVVAALAEEEQNIAAVSAQRTRVYVVLAEHYLNPGYGYPNSEVRLVETDDVRQMVFDTLRKR